LFVCSASLFVCFASALFAQLCHFRLSLSRFGSRSREAQR
jgi:hypothetical protein